VVDELGLNNKHLNDERFIERGAVLVTDVTQTSDIFLL
jgi:hypothetical protein